MFSPAFCVAFVLATGGSGVLFAQTPDSAETLLLARPLPQSGEVVPHFEQYPLIARSLLAPGVRAPGEGALRWLSVTGKALVANAEPPASGIRLFPIEAGHAVVRMRGGLRRVAVLEVKVVDDQGSERSLVAVSRSLPDVLQVEPSRSSDESDPNEEYFYSFRGPAESMPSVVQVISEGQDGRYADALRDVPLSSQPCAPGPLGNSPASRESRVMCARTPAIRVAVDIVERNHPATTGHTLIGEVGGVLELQFVDSPGFRLPIGAPSELEKNGPGRYRVRVRTRILRTFRAGPPAVGSDDADAKRVALVELDAASRMWGQCGFSLGPRSELDVEIVDPPELSLLTVGCDAPLLATGGDVDLKIEGRRVTLRTANGQTPQALASRLAQALREFGYQVRLFQNAQMEHVALPSFDIQVADRLGRPVSIEPARGSLLSSDPTLRVCAAQIDLADGLEHFNDFNAASGTSEERVLLRALSDDDPTTIELVIVPHFGGLGRIGESFIYSPGGSVQNALILDRTGIQAGARSFTLAHELGHVLLDLPGHPDDFGVDTPTSLMDADAADSTIFGPRRLTLDDCQGALRQNGRLSPVPLIVDWPLQTP